jgi:hypothetical protein
VNFRATDESTEMLLTDYLEGRLDPARQKEIDAYLERHPRERQVIEQLRSQRDLLGELPKDQAPPEIYEAVSGQIERSVLLSSLSEIASEKTGAMRSRPARLALAAVVLLSMGLGVVIYIIVSPPAGNPGTVGAGGGPIAMNSPAGQVSSPAPRPAGDDTSRVPAPLASVPAPLAAPGDQASPVSPLSAAPVQAEAQRSNTAGASAVDAVPLPSASVRATPAVRRSLKSGQTHPALTPEMAAKASPDAKVSPDAKASPEQAGELPVFQLSLRSSNPLATQGRIEQFLHAGGWSFSASPALTPTDPDTKASVTAGEKPTDANDSVLLPSAADGAAAGGTTPTSPTPAVTSRLLIRVEGDQLDALKSALLSVVQSASPPAWPTTQSTDSPPAVQTQPPPPPATAGDASLKAPAPQNSDVTGGAQSADQARPRMVNLLIIISPPPAAPIPPGSAPVPPAPAAPSGPLAPTTAPTSRP